MVTIILVNLPHLTLHIYKYFFVMKTFKIYSLSSFQIHKTVLLTIIIMLYITSPGLTYFITKSLYILITYTHFI